MAASDGHAGGRRPSGEPADDYVGGRRPSGEPADDYVGGRRPSGEPADDYVGGRRPSGEPADDYVGGRRPSGEPADEIDRVLSEIVAPLIRADGGELWIVSRDDTQLVLHLGGRYSGCPGNTLARRRIIEPAIQSVAPRLQVTVTSGTLVPPGASRVPS